MDPSCRFFGVVDVKWIYMRVCIFTVCIVSTFFLHLGCEQKTSRNVKDYSSARQEIPNDIQTFFPRDDDELAAEVIYFFYSVADGQAGHFIRLGISNKSGRLNASVSNVREQLAIRRKFGSDDVNVDPELPFLLRGGKRHEMPGRKDEVYWIIDTPDRRGGIIVLDAEEMVVYWAEWGRK